MSARSKSFSGSPVDAETTAELPVLDIAAHEARHGHDPLSRTDSWAAPTVSLAIPPQLANLAPELTAEPQTSPAAAKLERGHGTKGRQPTGTGTQQAPQ